MEKRFFLFIVLASALLFANMLLMNWLNPPQPPKPKPKPQQQAKEEEPKPEPEVRPTPAEPPQVVAVEPKEDPQAESPAQWFALGSLNPNDPYKMLVILTSRGAAVERIELNSPQLRDVDEAWGYLGRLATESAPEGAGVIVRVVGKGTPAELAGLQVDDVISGVNGEPIKNLIDFNNALRKTQPGQQVPLTIQRGDAGEQSLTLTLGKAPLQIVHPERDDPTSLLLTLERLGDREITRDIGLETREGQGGAEVTQVTEDSPAARAMLKIGDVITKIDERDVAKPSDLTEVLNTIPKGTRVMFKVTRESAELKLPVAMPTEIAGLKLRTGTWQVVSHDESQATFRWPLAGGLEVLKHYRLAKKEANAVGMDHHLVLEVEIRNTSTETRKVAYQLDGPTGLPTEGWWYANKIGRDGFLFSSPVGVRDVAVYFQGQQAQLIGAPTLFGDKPFTNMTEELPLIYAGIDAQYVAAALLPQRKEKDEKWLSKVQPLRVGMVPEDKTRRKLINTSVRLISETMELTPEHPSFKHEYVFFAGPKSPELLAQYGLDELIYYGWPIWGVVARMMLKLLHLFHSIVGNYGLAIIMLTVLVRGCMFPLSRKQAISAQKMQELQPEIKKLAEKYKNDLEKRNKAQQELFKKHSFNPLGGCWLMFLQLPVFIGLYRSLMVGVELWQAPLISGWRWCSNLAAPDMLYNWSSWMPQFLVNETGWLGPYFNLLPIITVSLFLWQQKMFMPPPTDEQAAMQQKMIKYMMVFMGFMFFKVASGLCIYFIASSLWGIAERKLLPKTMKPKSGGAEQPATVRPAPAATAGGNGSATSSRRKQRGKR